MRYAILTSGSCGNAYAFFDGERTILVDDGLTLTGLKKRLDAVGIPFDSISDLYLTHSHPDHSKGLGVLFRNLGLKIHVSLPCLESDEGVFRKLGLSRQALEAFSFGEVLESGSFVIRPFRTSHDSAGSCGYRIECGSDRFFLMTDTGVYSEEAVELAKDCQVLFLESNYDEEMLEEGRYPLFLKKRISGERGHLSNSQAKAFLHESGAEGRRVFLIHLSANNNSVERVQALYCERAGNVTVCERGATYGGYDGTEEK